MSKLSTLLLAMFLLVVCSLKGQFSANLKLGFSSYQGDLHCRTDEGVSFLETLKPAYGLGLRVPISKAVGLRAEGTYFQLSGDESNFSDKGHQERGWSFENKFWELGAVLDWELFGKNRFKGENGGFKRTLTPLLLAGVGAVFNNPIVNFRNANSVGIKQDLVNGKKTKLAVPVGVGLKYYLSERLALALEAGYRLPISDYYDGVSMAIGTGQDDSYGFGGVTGAFLFGTKKDIDGDGVADKNDSCPDEAGLVALNGCPDRDLDGIPDRKDDCPDMFGPKDLKGCPDTDGDGLIDRLDGCPQIAGGINLKGCPDTDGDGVIDMEDVCPNTPGLRSMSGCPDTDGDGIVDAEDECPNESGTVLNNGCPVKDADEDGIPDAEDECPNVAGGIATGGCPDTDGDGIADKNDSCPDTPGIKPEGCPEPIRPIITPPSVTESSEIEERFSYAMRNIKFSTSSSNFTNSTYNVLQEVVSVLKAYPSLRVTINGYTDSRGNADFNQRLSERRAKAVKDYLTGQGIDAGRLNYAGLGEANPISDNNTPEGRDQNRRVEFVIIK